MREPPGRNARRLDARLLRRAGDAVWRLTRAKVEAQTGLAVRPAPPLLPLEFPAREPHSRP